MPVNSFPVPACHVFSIYHTNFTDYYIHVYQALKKNAGTRKHQPIKMYCYVSHRRKVIILFFLLTFAWS